MAKQSSPHTESGKNVRVSQTDLEPESLEQEAGTGEDAELYKNYEGAQMGANRGEHFAAWKDGHHITEEVPVARVGALTSRAGAITSRRKDERMRQEKARPAAQAGVNRA